MNKKQYAKFYGYGAAALGDFPTAAPIHQLRYENFQKFLDANLRIVPTPEEGYICCQAHIEHSGRYKCYLNCVRFGNSSEVWDHVHGMRFKGLRKSYFAATHPYNFDPKEDYSNEILDGLIAKAYPAEKSWYYPGRTNLLLIGTEFSISLLNIDFLGKPIQEISGTRTTPIF